MDGSSKEGIVPVSMRLQPDRTAAMPHYRRMVLANDLVVLISEERSLPMVSIYFLLDAGAGRDPKGKQGLANLTVEALRLGTVSYSGLQVDEELDFTGASLESFCDRDFAVIGFHTLKRNLMRGLDVFREILMHPTFPEEEIGRKIAEVQASIRSSAEEPATVAEKAFRKALYGKSPYGHPVEGFEASLNTISREDIVEFYRRHYHPNIGILAVVGDIGSRVDLSSILAPLEDWRGDDIPPELFESDILEGPRLVEAARSIDQAHIVLGHEGIDRANPDYYAISVMNNILGAGGFSSRLMKKIRSDTGLAYSVESIFNAHKHRGSFRVVVQTRNASAVEVIRIVLDEMKRIREDGVTAQELSTAKKYLSRRFPMRVMGRDSFARFIAQVEYYGLGRDYYNKYASYIESVKREEVHRAARDYLHPDRCVISIVADLEKVDLTRLKI
jgi:zinc protease